MFGKQNWIYEKSCWYNEIPLLSLIHSLSEILLNTTKHQKYNSCILY